MRVVSTSPPRSGFRSAATQSLGGVFTSYWSHRQLILQMARRDVMGRYRGSFLGLAWSFITPLLMLAVYTFLFGVIFKARWGASTVESHVISRSVPVHWHVPITLIIGTVHQRSSDVNGKSFEPPSREPQAVLVSCGGLAARACSHRLDAAAG